MECVRSGKDFRLSADLAAGGRVAVTFADCGFGGTKISILESSLSLSPSLLLLTSIITEDRPAALLSDSDLLVDMFRCHFSLGGACALAGVELDFLGIFCGCAVVAGSLPPLLGIFHNGPPLPPESDEATEAEEPCLLVLGFVPE
jgi:hypothetical protein